MSIGLIGTQKDIVNILMADPITKGDVKLLQQRLNEINKHIDPKGKPLAADGDFGLNSRKNNDVPQSRPSFSFKFK